MKEPTALEEVLGSPAMAAAGTLFAASATGPLGAAAAAAVLPSLLSSMAGQRMQHRIEEAIKSLETEFHAMREDVYAMSDAQYKLVTEAVSAMMRATDQQKLERLRLVAANGVRERALSMQKAQVLSRIIRDVTPEELDLVLAAAPNKILAAPDFTQAPNKVAEEVRDFQVHGWHVLGNDPSVKLLVSGLLSLGLIVDANLMSHTWELTPIAYSLIALLQQR